MSHYTYATLFCWLIMLLYWGYSSRNVKTTVYAQTTTSRYIYLAFLLLSFVIVYSPAFAIGPLAYQIIPVTRWGWLTGAGITVAAIGFAIWARKVLGDNWSGNVTLKKDHQLVQSGPYRIVRHPIYTGFEWGLLGAAITVGQLKGFVGVGVIFLNHFYKTTMEEEILYEQFPEQYTEYAKRVKRLVPFIF